VPLDAKPVAEKGTRFEIRGCPAAVGENDIHDGHWSHEGLGSRGT
jgi:hypothetical protein